MSQPLPPDIWSSLPGREFYTEAAGAGGFEQPWRPISLSPELTLNSALALLPAIAALVAIMHISKEDQPAILTGLVVLVAASSILGILQAGTGNRLVFYRIWSEGWPAGLFANRNHQAALLACGLGALIAWGNRPNVPERKRQFYRGASTVTCLLIIPVLLMTGSRSGLVLGIVAILLSLVAVRRLADKSTAARSRGRLAKVIPVLPYVALLAILSSMYFLSKETSVQRFISLETADEARLVMLAPMLEMLKTFNVVGIGFGVFDPVFRTYEPVAHLNPTYFNHAHNDFLEVLLEGGAASAILLLLFLAWWLTRSWKLWRSSSRRTLSHLGRLGSVMTLVLMIGSLSDYPLRTPILMVVFAIGCGWMQLARSDAVSRGA